MARMSAAPSSPDEQQSPFREIIQPFADLIRAPRALWGINLGYLIEGMVYFGMLGYLAMHFSSNVFKGVESADVHSHEMVGVLTAGITISMFFLGFVADKWGVRQALTLAFFLMLCGRFLIAGAPALGLQPEGLWSPLHLVTVGGMILVVIGYGMYQPAAYAGVRQYTTEKTAGMAFAMLYALMNLGGWLPSFAFLLRDDDFLGLGITGVFWVYTFFTVGALMVTLLILTPGTVKRALERVKEEAAKIAAAKGADEEEKEKEKDGEGAEAAAAQQSEQRRVPVHLHVLIALVLVAIYFRVGAPYNYYVIAGVAAAWIVVSLIPATACWLARHPLADGKFFFFIFALIPVQTLFTYNWLILPQYINRSFDGWIGKYFEIAANANPLLIFIAVPMIAAVTQKQKVYSMMLVGTLVMAAPAFLLVIGPHTWTLFAYLLIMTIGEAMWQPRFLQYAAEIAPEGRTGVYMGVAQLPWFLTKMLVPWLYSGWMMDRYCPAEGPKDTQTMWLIFACIAMTSTLMLLVAKGWIGKDFKTKSEG
jgi:proton-dependent oligopeptide transporter, POT family